MTARPADNPPFREEMKETLAELDAGLLELEAAPEREESLARVFRSLHTLKGACDMYGLSVAVALLHDVETLWDPVRRGNAPLTRHLVDLTLALKDRLEPVADTGRDLPPDERLSTAMAAFEIPDGTRPELSAPLSTPGSDAAGTPDGARTFRIRLAPSDSGHLAKLDPLSFLQELKGLGETEVWLDTSGVPRLEELDLTDCRLRWEIRLTTGADADAVKDVFLFLDNPRDVSIEEAAPSPPGKTPVISDQAVQRHCSPPAGPATEQASSMPPPVPAAAAVVEQTPAVPAGRAGAPAQTLRVDTAKLDNLVNLVGELVIAQARLSQITGAADNPELTGVAEEIERLVVELRDNALGIRMLPIGTTFNRFRRLVRDLSAELGKEIDLLAEGGETELDKTVMEQLGDPLVHLLRNSIDHGMEPPQERAEAGKPRRGRIRLAAKQAGGAVIIRIEDDGRGLDPERIRAKAVERGLLAPEARLTSQEIWQLVFAPGFSTAETVTSVSGRGVGMDVVKRSIEALRGTVDIDSELGQGTAVIVTLPLTLAIIDGLQVRAGGELYVIPLAMVEECVEMTQGQDPAASANRTLSVRGKLVPFVRLRELFGLEGRPPKVEQVVVTLHENGRTGIAVDEVIGQQQTVIKSLGRYIGKVEGFSGATINGDGSMALILDVPRLVGSLERSGMP